MADKKNRDAYVIGAATVYAAAYSAAYTRLSGCAADPEWMISQSEKEADDVMLGWLSYIDGQIDDTVGSSEER